MERVFCIIAAGIFGGLLARKLSLPGGAVVGSMLASGCTAVLIPGSFLIPASWSTAIQTLLGISLGLTFDRSFLKLFGPLLPVAIASTLVLLGVSIMLAVVVGRLGIVDFSTALFGFAPGGMSGMSLLAQAEGYQTSAVAFIHTVRIFTLFVIVPVVGRMLWFRTVGS